MSTRRHSRRAFTLIEALCAIMVIVIVVPVILEGFNVADNVAGLTRQTADATLLAESSMDELVSTRELANGTSPGEQRIGPTVYDVEVSVDEWDNEVNVNQLTVTVHWNHRGPRSVALTTIVYTPATTQNTTGTPLGLGGTP